MASRSLVGMKISADRGIDRFGSAGGVIDLIRQASENGGDRFGRGLLLFFRKKAQAVKRSGIPVTLFAGKFFRYICGDFRKWLGRRAVIKIDQR